MGLSYFHLVLLMRTRDGFASKQDVRQTLAEFPHFLGGNKKPVTQEATG
jgi:hypothetical protein